MTKETYENHQIFKVDGKNVFVEVMKSGFEIGKVVLNFMQYDENQTKGNRIKESISVFIDIPEFLQICQDMKSGRLSVLAKKANETAASGGYRFASAIYTHMGGTSAKKLKERNKERPDGMSLSRKFKITPGSRQPWILSAEVGPGEEMDNGLIAPKYKQPEAIIRVPLSNEHFKQLFLITEAYIQGYITSKFINK